MKKYIKMLYLLGAITLLCLGGAIAYMGNNTGNPLLILVGFVGLACSFALFRARHKQGDVRYTGKKKVANGKPPNTLDLTRGWVDFVYVENAVGQSQKCHNDNKYYNVQAEYVEEIKEEFKLPDDDETERYYDPGEFSNPVTMPSNKKYFTWSASTMQKISVGVMGLIIGAEIIGLVMVGG